MSLLRLSFLILQLHMNVYFTLINWNVSNYAEARVVYWVRTENSSQCDTTHCHLSVSPYLSSGSELDAIFLVQYATALIMAI